MRTEADRESVKQCLVTVSQRDGLVFERNDGVIEEAPLSIVINGKAYAVMMITLADTADFVFGFLFTDGIIQHASTSWHGNLSSRKPPLPYMSRSPRRGHASRRNACAESLAPVVVGFAGYPCRRAHGYRDGHYRQDGRI